MEKVGELLEEAANQWGDREAVVSCQQGIRKTYSQVDLLCSYDTDGMSEQC